MVEWEYVDQVSINILFDNFLFIDCNKESLKLEVLNDRPVFYKGVNFRLIDWQPKFDSKQYKPKKSP